MRTIDEILQEVALLPYDQRLTLAHRLLVSDEPTASHDVHEAWDRLIRERIDRYDQGQARSKPASEVFSDLDQKLGA